MSRVAVVLCDVCNEYPAADDRGVCSIECLNKKHPPLPPRDYHSTVNTPTSYSSRWCSIV